MRDPTDDSLNREESFRVEALEPRILLSADPVLGEMARIADKAGWDDPMSNLAAIVEVIDATENQDAKAAEVETADEAEVEMAWPEEWVEKAEREVATHAPLDTSAGEDADYAFGSTFVSTSVDRDSISPTGPPASTTGTTEFLSTGGAHTPPAESVSDIHHLMLEGGNTGAVTAITLETEAQATFDSAVVMWSAAGGSVSAGLNFIIGDLAAGVLASYDLAANLITVDGDAAGAGWFIDTTAEANTEYTTLNGYALEAEGNAAAEGIDLLTVMLHEIGH
ncbi:MAG: LEPR-XLL domain-containing protein, partial [Sulfitobacter litoralis]|nr:LEPR-XLL domain-containing protein [Sulfitobacter litoralis]